MTTKREPTTMPAKAFLFVDGSGRGVRTKMDAAHIRKHWKEGAEEDEMLEGLEDFLSTGEVGDSCQLDQDCFIRIR